MELFHPPRICSTNNAPVQYYLPLGFKHQGGKETGQLARSQATSMVRLQHGLPALPPPDHSPLSKVAQRAEEDVAGEGEYCMAMMNPLCGTGGSLESGGGRGQQSQFFKWTQSKASFPSPLCKGHMCPFQREST